MVINQLKINHKDDRKLSKIIKLKGNQIIRIKLFVLSQGLMRIIIMHHQRVSEYLINCSIAVDSK